MLFGVGWGKKDREEGDDFPPQKVSKAFCLFPPLLSRGRVERRSGRFISATLESTMTTVPKTRISVGRNLVAEREGPRKKLSSTPFQVCSAIVLCYKYCTTNEPNSIKILLAWGLYCRRMYVQISIKTFFSCFPMRMKTASTFTLFETVNAICMICLGGGSI